jgi:hypothetical protein
MEDVKIGLLDHLRQFYNKYQKHKKTSITKFASKYGFSPPVFTKWLKGEMQPNLRNARLLVSTFNLKFDIDEYQYEKNKKDKQNIRIERGTTNESINQDIIETAKVVKFSIDHSEASLDKYFYHIQPKDGRSPFFSTNPKKYIDDAYFIVKTNRKCKPL